jgi:FMN reductase
MAKSPIHILVICGTSRPGNFTSRAVALLMDELGAEDGVSAELFDPAKATLDFPGLGQQGDDSVGLKSKLSSATGVILATPEYHGTFSACLKLIIENMGFPSGLGGKPVGLLGVAAGQIGAIKSLEHLRSVCSHVGAIVLPGPVSVSGVQTVFGEDGECLDEQVEKRVRGLARNLIDYIRQNICPRVALENMVRPQ